MVTKSGASALSLTGANTYSGSTTVNGGSLSLGTTGSLASTNLSVTGGSTLLLGASSQLASGAALSMNNGTLSMGGGSSTRAAVNSINSLTLTGNSTIDFSSLSGNSSLTFQSINLNGFSLSVLNWNGTNLWGNNSSVDGALTKLYTGSILGGNMLNGAFSNINFYSGSSIGSGFMGNGSWSGGGISEIVPVPEPGVILAALMLVGWLIFSQRALLVRLIARRATN